MMRLAVFLLLLAAPGFAGEKRSHFHLSDSSGAVIYRMTVLVTFSRVEIFLADAYEHRYVYRWEQRDENTVMHRLEALESGDAVECYTSRATQTVSAATQRQLETRFARMIEDLLAAHDPIRVEICGERCPDFSPLSTREVPLDCEFDKSFDLPCAS